MLRFWGRRGVDGFRIDSAAALVKDPRLPDVVGGAECEGLDDFAANPDHPFLDRPEVHEIYRDWNRVFAEFSPPLMAVGETWVGKDRRAAYLREGELQQVFNFEFPRVRWHAGEYRRVIEETVGTAWSVGAAPTWMLGSHDAMRQVSLLGLPPEVNPTVWLAENGQRPPADLRTGTRRARAAALLELALPGSVHLPGEELGLPEVTGLAEQVLTDPVHRHRGHKDKGRDGCRVPLPWTRHGPSCGFSAVAGWLPQPPGWGGTRCRCSATTRLDPAAVRAAPGCAGSSPVPVSRGPRSATAGTWWRSAGPGAGRGQHRPGGWCRCRPGGWCWPASRWAAGACRPTRRRVAAAQLTGSAVRLSRSCAAVAEVHRQADRAQIAKVNQVTSSKPATR